MAEIFSFALQVSGIFKLMHSHVPRISSLHQQQCISSIAVSTCSSRLMVDGAQVAGILQGNAELTGRALDSDCIVEPVRGPLIPGFASVKQAAKDAGASLSPWC